MIKKLNDIFEKHQQKTRIIFWSAGKIELNDGLILSGNDKKKFVNRVTNKKTDLWVNNVDRLLNGEITDDEIRSTLCSIGGKSCQLLHGRKIRQNLNTGIPWIKGKKGHFTPWNKGLNKNLDDRIKKLSLDRLKEGNPMYGKPLTSETKEKLSCIMKSKIMTGEFTPNSNNRNTHWDSFFDGKKFRSSWEALYQFINPNAEYEKLRIRYSIQGVEKIFIVDFVDYKNKIAIEIKPKELCFGEKYQAKLKSLIDWANKNEFQVLVITQDWFLLQDLIIDYSRFDEKTQRKIKNLYETDKKNRDI